MNIDPMVLEGGHKKFANAEALAKYIRERSTTYVEVRQFVNGVLETDMWFSRNRSEDNKNDYSITIRGIDDPTKFTTSIVIYLALIEQIKIYSLRNGDRVMEITTQEEEEGGE